MMIRSTAGYNCTGNHCLRATTKPTRTVLEEGDCCLKSEDRDWKRCNKSLSDNKKLGQGLSKRVGNCTFCPLQPIPGHWRCLMSFSSLLVSIVSIQCV